MSSSKQADSNDERSNLIHQEMLKLVALIAAATAAFLVTRAIAANNRDMNLRDAAEWCQRGQRQLDAGDAERFAQSGGILPVVSRADACRVKGVITIDSILKIAERRSHASESQPAAIGAGGTHAGDRIH